MWGSRSFQFLAFRSFQKARSRDSPPVTSVHFCGLRSGHTEQLVNIPMARKSSPTQIRWCMARFYSNLRGFTCFLLFWARGSLDARVLTPGREQEIMGEPG